MNKNTNMNMNQTINKEKLQNAFLEMKIKLTEEQITQFINYYELLIERNNFINLTSIVDFDEVLLKHFIDSISVFQVKNLTNKIFKPDKIELSEKITLIDVGTGAGFPGIPLKIVFPHLHVTLLDSLNKRVDFLNDVIVQLQLNNIQAIHGRAEDFGKDSLYREQFDICVSRAVADLTVLSELCVPFIKVGGYFISYKGDITNEEIKKAQRALFKLNAYIKNKESVSLLHSDIVRKIIIMSKDENTDLKYPRRAGIPLKRPLE